MKHVFLVFSLMAFFSLGAKAQTSDSTYTTLSSQQINGAQGLDTCSHEWFYSFSDVTDVAENRRTQTTSRQCVKCGKQNSTINIWQTYIKDDEEDN